ncbi:IPT/TIG domain-containing protein [Streptomyces violaceusniger]|uniref:IPT/TIG domain-containing protein n=1 Tax=Streptomyces violaceusniger TaxID=68280 RepID=UPI0038120F8A
MAAPNLTTLSPIQGHNGQILTLTGQGLTGTTRVTFSGKSFAPATVSATTVTVETPVLPVGQVDVSVTASGITSNSLPFYYIASPMCRSLSLNEGPAAPTLITIFGNALSTATGVLFGSVGPGTGLVIVSDTALNITTPPHGSFGPACTDTVDVTVTTAGGSTFPTGASCQYTYYQAPNITGLSPTAASTGSTVTIVGTCLPDATQVTFTPTGGGQATQAAFTNISTSRITTVVPPSLVAGTYDIRVTTPGGQTPIVPIDVFTI